MCCSNCEEMQQAFNPINCRGSEALTFLRVLTMHQDKKIETLSADEMAEDMIAEYERCAFICTCCSDEECSPKCQVLDFSPQAAIYEDDFGLTQ